jgi:RNA polymerase sigma-70 factor, ECF subfamily
MSEPNLLDLAARLARGDEAAFAELYDASADRLHQYLTVRMGSHDVASDAMQAAFLRVVKNRRRFRKGENPIAYLFQIARNEAARATSKQRRRRDTQPLADGDLLAMADGVAATDDAETVAAALARLDTEDRDVVDLKIYAGLTFREIAAVTGKPQSSLLLNIGERSNRRKIG